MPRSVEEIIEAMRTRHQNQAPHRNQDEKILIAAYRELERICGIAFDSGAIVDCQRCESIHVAPACRGVAGEPQKGA